MFSAAFVRRRACLLAFPLLLPAALAQQTVNNGSLRGQVTDPSGAVVRGANVFVYEGQTGIITRTSTDQDGRFRFPYLKVGPYELTVRAAGFAEATQKVNLTGRRTNCRFRCKLLHTRQTSQSVKPRRLWKQPAPKSPARSPKQKSTSFL